MRLRSNLLVQGGGNQPFGRQYAVALVPLWIMYYAGWKLLNANDCSEKVALGTFLRSPVIFSAKRMTSCT